MREKAHEKIHYHLRSPQSRQEHRIQAACEAIRLSAFQHGFRSGRNRIESVFPETGIHTDAETDEPENIKKISGKLALFIQKMIDSSVCEIHYFLTSDVTPEERYEILKRYDSPADYTYYKSEAENRDACREMVEISRIIKEQCGRFHLPCYETAYNREKVIKDFLWKLKDV